MIGQEFPWTPGGTKLLANIKEVIDKNGGMAAMYEIVNAEVNGTEYSRHAAKIERVFKLTIKHRIFHYEACQLIPMPLDIFSRKIAEYKLSKSIEYGI